MELTLIIDDKMEYEDDQNNYDSEVYGDDDNFVLILKSLKNIKPNFEDVKLMIDDNLSNNQEINKTLKDLLSRKAKAEITVIIRNQKIDEFSYVNKIFPTGCTIDVRNLNDNLLVNILDKVSFNQNIKFLDKYNKYSQLNSLELKKCYNYIHQIVKMINYYNFTPLEKLIFVFDMVREKIYKSTDSEDISISRDIIQISNDDHIVCEGYANLIGSICSSLGIENEIAFWKKNNSNRGHATNIIYLNDQYYDIHHAYEVDATSLSKKDENDLDYINNYFGFLFDLNITFIIKNKRNYTNIDVLDMLLFKKIEYRKKSYDKVLKLGAPIIISLDSAKLLVQAILEFVTKVGNKELMEMCLLELDKINKEKEFDSDNIELIYQRFNESNNCDIDENKLMQAIYKVRRVEHLIDPLKYPLSINVINKIYRNSFAKTKEQLLLDMIFGDYKFDIISEIPVISEIDEETSIDKVESDIKRIKLLRIMKKELKNKKAKK